VNSAATQQVENKFEYYKKKENGGYTNKGRFIMYFDTDLTMKQINSLQSSLIRRFRNVK
jgi:hypothetical protein